MASSVVMAMSEQSRGEALVVSEEPKSRGRKHSKASNPKKLPQRGLGVAQLERLRIQEKWKKMMEQQPYLLNYYNYQNAHSSPPPLSAPLGASHYGGPVVFKSSGDNAAFYGFERAASGLVAQRGVGFNNGGFGFGSPGTIIDPILVDPEPYNRIIDGASNRWEKVGALYETSRELSSIPKMQSPNPSFDLCNFCSKKKRFVNDISTLGGENSGFGGARASRPTGCAGTNIAQQGVEVLAIHRKQLQGNSYRGSGGGKVVMEYEFFPGAAKQHQHGGTFPKEMEILPVEASLPLGGASGQHSNLLDLSLKLSY